jgi:hypothetical protein
MYSDFVGYFFIPNPQNISTIFLLIAFPCNATFLITPATKIEIQVVIIRD